MGWAVFKCCVEHTTWIISVRLRMRPPVVQYIILSPDVVYNFFPLMIFRHIFRTGTGGNKHKNDQQMGYILMIIYPDSRDR